MDKDKIPKETKEVRQLNSKLELRAIIDGQQESRTIGGYALKYNELSEIMYDYWGDEFVEEFAPGAFDESLQKRDQKALWNHKMEMPLGSVKANTLRFNSDTTGLSYDIDLPNNSWGNDALESVRRGDVDGSSFGFICVSGGDKWSKVVIDGREIYRRTIMKAELYEVSPCTFPAYSSSEINVRSLEDFKKEQHSNELRKRLILKTYL